MLYQEAFCRLVLINTNFASSSSATVSKELFRMRVIRSYHHSFAKYRKIISFLFLIARLTDAYLLFTPADMDRLWVRLLLSLQVPSTRNVLRTLFIVALHMATVAILVVQCLHL